jgi:phage terminase large subunit-like protein
VEGCRFDWQKARHVEEFGRRFLRHSTGRWAGQPFDLLEWQREHILYPLFGWVQADGRRRFRFADVFTPKKNGKSALCSYLGLYMLVADGEPRAEVYAAATDRSQSRLVFDEAERMVKASPALSAKIKAISTEKVLRYQNSKFQALGGDHAGSEGKNIHAVIYDEIHAWSTPTLKKLFASLYYGSIAREQPLSVVISTAGEDDSDESALWVEIWQRCEAILHGDTIDTRRLAYVAAATREEAEGEGWLDPEVHQRANPSYGVTIDPDEMLASAKEAQDSPVKKARFLRYRLNRPVPLVNLWLPVELWDDCNEPVDFPPGCSCYGAIDLSSSDDLTALVLVRREPGDEDDDDTYHVRPYFWLPEETLAQRTREGDHQYATWHKHGFLETTPGNVIDYGWIRRRIVEFAAEHDLREIGFDPWHALETATTLGDQNGIVMVEVRQGWKTMAEPMAKLERLLRGGRLAHGGHPVLRWNFANTRAKSDPAGNLRPVKPEPNSRKKIDGCVALIMAISRAMLDTGSASAYESGAPMYAEDV